MAADTDQCYTDTDGYPLTYALFVLTNPLTLALSRLTRPSGEGSVALDYGPKAYQADSNVFATKVRRPGRGP